MTNSGGYPPRKTAQMQTVLERARAMDVAERPVEAIAAYEQAVTEPDTELNVFLDLAVLYFVCFDFGYAAHHRLPDDLMRSTWDGFDAALDAAQERFGPHPEILCWRMYIDFIIGRTRDTGLDHRKLQELLATGQTILPYMCLFTSLAGLDHDSRQPYRAGAMQLLQASQPRQTERQRYVFSVLESALEKNSG